MFGDREVSIILCIYRYYPLRLPCTPCGVCVTYRPDYMRLPVGMLVSLRTMSAIMSTVFVYINLSDVLANETLILDYCGDRMLEAILNS